MAYSTLFRVRQVIAAMLTIAAIALVGCGDSNVFEGLTDQDTKEAQTEAALIAMDNGDYQTAINLLVSLVQNNPGDTLLIQYLGSAYAGAAGMDTLDLLAVMDLLHSLGQSGNIDMIGLVLGDSDGQLTSAEVAAKLAHLNNAIEMFGSIPSPNADQTIHLGILSMARLSLSLGDLILTDLGSDSIILTEEGIKNQYGGTPADFSGSSSETLDTIEQDLTNMLNAGVAINAISNENNDLYQDMVDFINSINSDQVPGQPITITTDELENYVDNL